MEIQTDILLGYHHDANRIQCIYVTLLHEGFDRHPSIAQKETKWMIGTILSLKKWLIHSWSLWKLVIFAFHHSGYSSLQDYSKYCEKMSNGNSNVRWLFYMLSLEFHTLQVHIWNINSSFFALTVGFEHFWCRSYSPALPHLILWKSFFSRSVMKLYRRAISDHMMISCYNMYLFIIAISDPNMGFCYNMYLCL